MTWLVVARKEFTDAVRARVLWGIVAVFGFLTAGIAVLVRLVPGETPNALTSLVAATEFAAILVPIVSLVAAYLAIAGERESGSIKVLLGLPPSRAEVLLGKFVGRSGVVVLGLVVGFAIGGLGTLLTYGSVPLTAFVGATLLTAALGVAFVGVAVGLSATTSSRAHAMTASIAVYLVFVMLWDLIPQGLYFLVHGASPSGAVPGWFLGLQVVSPAGTYGALVNTVLAATDPALPGLADQLGGPLPVYLEPWFLLAVLVAWTAVPLGLGYRRFRRADL